MLHISYRFDTNKSRAAGNIVTFANTSEGPHKPRGGHGPTFNGLTSLVEVIVDNSADAFDFLDARLGLETWSLWWVMPDPGVRDAYYVVRECAPSRRQSIYGLAAEVICGRSPRGLFDANLEL